MDEIMTSLMVSSVTKIIGKVLLMRTWPHWSTRNYTL
jgi:hypothetical protein